MDKSKIRLSNLRIDNDLKQKDIADKLGVERSTYAMWEIGKSDFPILTANELANYYKVSIDYLLGMSDIKFETERNEIDFNLMRKRLKKLRKNKGISQLELGDKVGFSQKTYSNYEVGSRVPTTFKLMYIAKYYNVSYDYLVGRSDIKEIKQ